MGGAHCFRSQPVSLSELGEWAPSVLSPSSRGLLVRKEGRCFCSAFPSNCVSFSLSLGGSGVMEPWTSWILTHVADENLRPKM